MKKSYSSKSQNNSTNSNEQVMQEAIQKASCLIELLTRQNNQFKLTIQELKQQYTELKIKQIETQELNKQLESKLLEEEIEKQKLQSQNEELIFELEKIKFKQSEQIKYSQKIQQKTKKNKQLHQKLATYTSKNILLTKELQNLRIQFKSLQNQNQYLLKQLKKSSQNIKKQQKILVQKQNHMSHNIQKKQNQFCEKLQTIDRTKDAFARRTQQLKQQNYLLFIQLDRIKGQNYQLQLINSQHMRVLDALRREIQLFHYFQEKINKVFEKVKTQKGRNQGRESLGEKIEQIQMFVNYRFQHIQSLIKIINQKVGKPEWKQNIRELNETQFGIQRLANYITELTNSKKQ